MHVWEKLGARLGARAIGNRLLHVTLGDPLL